MAEEKENPEAAEESGGEAGAAEQPASTEQPTGAEEPASTKQPEAAQEAQTGGEVSKDARQWAMFCHLLGLAGIVVPVVGNIVGPLVMWQIKKDEYPFVDEQGKEALNFQISMSIYGIISAILILACIGAFLLPAVYIVNLVFLLIAAIKANNGHHYRYPLTIRFIK
jgi:uncharacterized Tic20 family protein